MDAGGIPNARYTVAQFQLNCFFFLKEKLKTDPKSTIIFESSGMWKEEVISRGNSANS